MIMIHSPKSGSPRTFIRQVPKLGALLASTILLAACASSPQAPTESLNAAQQAISTADQARVADYASIDLSEARAKLAAAHIAVQNKEMIRAEQLADEAFVSAQLASAKAEEIKARDVNQEMKDSTETLRTEMHRNTGPQR